jgi:hypothetical protein
LQGARTGKKTTKGKGMKIPKCRKSLWFRFVTALMVLLLIEINPVPRSEAATEQQQPKAQPKLVAECIVAGTVLVVGTIIVYNLYKFCKKNLPPTPPPPKPPPVPPTNAPPPITNHFIIRPMDIPPFPTNEPPCTNCPPDTNVYVPPPVQYWVPSVWTNMTPQNITNNDAPNGGNWYDVSSLGYMDSNAVPPVLIFGFTSDVISNIQSSTDLVNWSNYTFNAWVSSNGVETVVYDGSGYPVITNYDGGNPTTTGPTNQAQIPIGIWLYSNQDPQKFFRVTGSP